MAEEPPNPQPQMEVNYSYPVRPHTAILFMRLALLQLGVAALSLLLGYPLLLLARAVASITSALVPYLLIVALLEIANVTLVILVVLAWVHTLFIIRPNEIMEQRGIWHIREHSHPTGKGESVQVSQTVLGRFFNYGTVHIRNQALGWEMDLDNIPEPHLYARVIKRAEGREVIRMLPGHRDV